MSPKLLLSLWRERWGKPFSTTFLLPPLQGRLNQWGDQLVHASAWAYPGAAIAAWVACIFVLLLTMSAQFSLGGQVAFSLLFIGVAVYVRRFNGTLVFLTLLGFCCIVSTRYLYWRFTGTLSQSFNADFVLGFCLCVAELYLWLLLMLRAIKSMCPITSAQFALPNDTNDWPSVDVLILGGEHSRATIEKAAVAALAFDWPKNSISIKILDDISRSDIADLAQTMGIKYGAYPDNTNGKAGCINRALAEATGELLAVVDCTQTLDKNFLQLVSGWFVQSPSLGMLQTPVHFLAPAPKSNNLTLLTEPGVNISAVLFRRSILLDVGGLDAGPASSKMHAALKLQKAGYTHAYFTLKPESTTEAIKLNHPFSGVALFWKQCLHALEGGMQFYSPLLWMTLPIIPLAYLYFEAHMIRTSLELFAAFALPHFLLTHIIHTKLQAAPRLSIYVGIREALLGIYMLIHTSLSFLLTEIRRSKNLFIPKRDTERALPLVFDGISNFAFYSILLAHLIGFTLGINRWMATRVQPDEFAPLYFASAAYSLLLLLAMLAVAKESRLILWRSHQQLQMPAMIKFSSGRSMSCMTENFPARILELRLPADVIVDTRSEINISIFRAHHELALTAQVVTQHDRVLQVTMDDAAYDDYRNLGSAVYSRDKNWPEWLPGRNADQLLPIWVTRAFGKLQQAAISLTIRIGVFPQLQQFSLWIQRWK